MSTFWFEMLTDHSRIDQYLRQTGIEMETYVCNDVPVTRDPRDWKHLVHLLLAAYIQRGKGRAPTRPPP